MNYTRDYHTLTGIDRFKHAIHYMKIGRLSQLVLSYKPEEIMALRDESERNILEWMLHNLTAIELEDEAPLSSDFAIAYSEVIAELTTPIDHMNVGNSKRFLTLLMDLATLAAREKYQFTINPLHYIHINSMNNSPLVIVRSLIYIVMLNILVDVCAPLITDGIMEWTNTWNSPLITSILSKSKIDNNDEDEGCFICSHTYKDQLINPPCACKTLIHLQCLIKLVNAGTTSCKICRRDFNHKRNRRGIFFPKIGVYHSPLMHHYVIVNKDKLNDQLHFAIAYLQVKRVEELLSACTKLDLATYIRSAMHRRPYVPSDDRIKVGNRYLTVLKSDYSRIHEIKNNKFLLLDYLYTGMLRENTPDKFAIIDLLLDTKIQELGININEAIIGDNPNDYDSCADDSGEDY